MNDDPLWRVSPFGHPAGNFDAGSCPQCGQPGTSMPVRGAAWITCPEHRMKWLYPWYIDPGHMLNLRRLTENERIVSGYREAEPIYSLQAEQLRMSYANEDAVDREIAALIVHRQEK